MPYTTIAQCERTNQRAVFQQSRADDSSQQSKKNRRRVQNTVAAEPATRTQFLTNWLYGDRGYADVPAPFSIEGQR